MEFRIYTTLNMTSAVIYPRAGSSRKLVIVLFIDHCRRQNFYPSLLRFVDRFYTVIHKMQNTRTKLLPSATVGE